MQTNINVQQYQVNTYISKAKKKIKDKCFITKTKALQKSITISNINQNIRYCPSIVILSNEPNKIYYGNTSLDYCAQCIISSY